MSASDEVRKVRELQPTYASSSDAPLSPDHRDGEPSGVSPCQSLVRVQLGEGYSITAIGKTDVPRCCPWRCAIAFVVRRACVTFPVDIPRFRLCVPPAQHRSEHIAQAPRGPGSQPGLLY